MRNITTSKALLTGLWCACVFAPDYVTAGVNVWTPLGPDGGRVYDVEFSRTSSGTFYAVGRAGVYRSTVTGDSFELLKEDFGQSPFDLAVDPAQADRVLVAADGLYVGAGPDWRITRSSTPDPGTKVATSRDGSTVYFAAGTRVFRSQDRGTTWQERAPIPGALALRLVSVLETDPTNAEVVYAGVYGFGLFVSIDGGGVWQPLGSEPAIARTFSFVIDPSNPARLLAVTETGLHTSGDGGVTWTATMLTAGLWDVDVDPFDSRVIYVAGIDIRKSTDGGATWAVLPVDQPSGALRLAIDPTRPSTLAAFNGDGVSVSTDSGATWAKRVAGFKGTITTAFSTLPSSRRNYFGVNGRGGVYYVEAGESVARSVNNDPLAMLVPQGLVGIHVLAVPGPADTLYAVLNTQVLAKSVDAGLHWSELPFPGPYVSGLTASPLEPRTLYAGGFPVAVHKSLDGGASWAVSDAGLPDELHVDAIAIARTPAILYAIGYLHASPNSPPEYGVFRSGDGGATWSPASSPQTRPILSVTVDPNDPQVVYAGFDGELRKTTDGGASWHTLTRNGTPLCCSFGGVVFDPTDSNVFYALHATGAWRTVDAGASWEPVLAPRPPTFTARGTLALDPADANRLLVGWEELGVRELTIAPDLGLAISAPASLTANALASYTLTLRNLGPFDATNVHVTAQLPAGATGVSASASGAVCAIAATTAACTFGVVRSGGSLTTIALGFVPAAGSVNVSASATGDQPDALTANNTVTSTLVANAPVPPARSGGGGSVSPGVLALLVALSLLQAFRTRSKKRFG